MVYKNFDLKNRPIKVQKIITVRFFLPARNQTLICCDGASRGNPGVAGYGFVCRDDQGGFIYAEAKGLGIATNYIDEIIAIAGASEWAIHNNKLDICINSYSKAAVRWRRIKELLSNIQFVHSMREINFSIDSMAKKGAGLERGEIIRFNIKPAFIHALESPEKIYY
ncbi:uncharacterized protein LOC113278855 [Papaver somniferum]|uniref:uncharacterized protein LOC113278855 n=1 Tax=Papaver somniferum TaxID=3469 RepID=UPI000E6F6596|nr:uncharacterized protein LOC113278855 [Papaver somniferum]